MKYRIIATDGNSRVGKLKTRHGTRETPFFMPVATKGAMKHIEISEAKKLKVKTLISNAFLLSLKPGLEVIKQFGGIHKFMNYDGVIFTDSGGFQMLDPEFLLKITTEGTTLRNPYSGEAITITPERVAEIQQTLKSDVAMILDDVPRHNSHPEIFKQSVENTLSWTKRFLNNHFDKKQLVFGIAQGGFDVELRRKSCQALNEMPVDGNAIGGLCIGEPLEKMHAMVQTCVKYLEVSKPRYLMGVGSPIDVVLSIQQGVDIFDSCMPTRNARHGEALTTQGKVRINHSSHKKDSKPIDENCECTTCVNTTRAYIHHLYRSNEVTAERLLSVHNIFYMQKLLEEARKAIKENLFTEYSKTILKAYGSQKL